MKEAALKPRAFVFDCDGTLLDSMGMWGESVPRFVSRFGVTATRRDFEETEHYPIPVCCRIYHEKWGIGDSPEDLERMYNEMLVAEYRSNIGLCDGALDVLEIARAAGIPMAIASSTSVPLLEMGLEANGIRGYFDGLFCTADYGTSKDEPRIYDIAREHLGADIRPEETWVFEDAPFGVESARRGGFKTVGVYDRNREAAQAELERVSDVYVRSLADVTLDRLEVGE